MTALPQFFCSCPACKRMCTRSPCWGTPAEIAALIAAGHAERLSLDYRAETYKGEFRRVEFLRPAAKGEEGQRAPYLPIGECTFLMKDGLCELHAAGLKPIEGRFAIHNGGTGNAAFEQWLDKIPLRKSIATAWDKYYGRALAQWFRLLDESPPGVN